LKYSLILVDFNTIYSYNGIGKYLHIVLKKGVNEMITGNSFNPVGLNNNWNVARALFSPSFTVGQRNTSNNMWGFNNPMSNSSSNFMVAAKSAANELSSTLNGLLGRAGAASVFARTEANSADNDILRVNSVNMRNNSNSNDMRVTVEQIALAQRNEGNGMTAAANAVDTGFTLGRNTFEIDVNGKKSSVSFDVRAGDTVRDAQNRMASAINGAGLGVTASVSAENGNSTLSLQSANTGITRAGQDNFSIRDMAGNAAAAAGVLGITQNAQNAQYRMHHGNVVGGLRTSLSNNVDLGNGVNAELRGAGTSTVSFGQNQTAMQNAARQMVNGFNKLFETVIDNNDNRRTNALQNRMQGLVKTHGTALAGIGISSNREGFLQINEERMKKAAEDGSLERFFTRNGTQQSFGFANRLSRIADDVDRAPGNFTSGTMPGYDGSMMRFSNFHTNRMNQFMNVGLLMDLMF
jgi:flagellar hook-associated protein 2